METKNHVCGGTILVGGSDISTHRYCTKCRAFTYHLEDDLPNGTNTQANQRAWDNGDDTSPGEEVSSCPCIRLNRPRQVRINKMTKTQTEAEVGPWMGVPNARQTLCAVRGCVFRGKPQRCLWDGAFHVHGCIHYDCDAAKPAVKRSGLSFRPGWGLLCEYHYAKLFMAQTNAKEK